MNTLKIDIIYHLQSEPVKLTNKQKKIRQFLLEHVTEVGYMSLKELSVNAAVSEVSILNFCTLFGFSNYVEMREEFRNYTKQCMDSMYMKNIFDTQVRMYQNDLYRYSSEIVENHNRMLRHVDLEDLDRCAKVLQESRDVFILGSNMSKLVADYMERRFNYLRIRCRSVNMGNMDLVQTVLADLGPEDTVILFSFPPYHIYTTDVVHYIKKCGSTLIAVVGSKESPAVLEEGISFLCETQNEYFLNSMSVAFHFVEIFIYNVALSMGKTKDEILTMIDKMRIQLTYGQQQLNESAKKT